MKKVKLKKEENIYQQKGYANRRAYLQDLANENGVDINSVLAVAEVLGENEDFDGLVTTIEDFKFLM